MQTFFFQNPSQCQCPPVRLCPPIPICNTSPPTPVLQPVGCTASKCPYVTVNSPYSTVNSPYSTVKSPYSTANSPYFTINNPYTEPDSSYVAAVYNPPPPPTLVPELPPIVTSIVNAPTSEDSLETPEVNDGASFKASKTTTAFTVMPRGRTKSTSIQPETFPTPPDDLYDSTMPEEDSKSVKTLLKVADVSASAKNLVPFDIYQKRYHYLRQLKNRLLRQFSAPSARKDNSSVCNNKKLARVMVKAMVNDVSISKRLVRKATELSFNGKKFDVLCAVGDFSYSIYAEQYCEASRGDVTCFAFI
uniref:Ground-like domain-containing protein n=1 Tax=Ditylenchus dipsaci TaxID=166011 RepID=A0A915EQF2_9BILA